MSDIFKYIAEEPKQKTKHARIVDGILAAIFSKEITKGDPLPSVNKFIQKLGFAGMTVVKALNILKERGIIETEDKVGYIVMNEDIKRELKVFLFLTGFNSYHKTLYNSVVEYIVNQCITIDLYFHHCNPKVFKSVLSGNIGLYGLYIITGFNHPIVLAALADLPRKKLLQIIRPPVLEGISFIGQDFYLQLKDSFKILKESLSKYDKFILIFPPFKGPPDEIKMAFPEFCIENGILCSVESPIKEEIVQKRHAFRVIEEINLLILTKIGEEKKLKLGDNFGVLSYNETPMKEIIRNGITVVSADFAKMGQSISRFIKNPKSTVDIFAPDVIIRNSL